MAMGSGVDWQAWHADYDNPDSALSKRLATVQVAISTALDSLPAGPLRVVSVCAGEGRDLLGVLEKHPRAHEVGALLVELDPGRADAARESAARLGVAGIEVLTGDAGIAGSYLGALPARHRRSPDLTDATRAELTTVGFTELTFGSPPRSWAVADREQLWRQPR